MAELQSIIIGVVGVITVVTPIIVAIVEIKKKSGEKSSNDSTDNECGKSINYGSVERGINGGKSSNYYRETGIVSFADYESLSSIGNVERGLNEGNETDCFESFKKILVMVLKLYFQLIFAIILPPLSVFLTEQKNKSRSTLINIFLTIFGYIPGIIHAFYIICENLKYFEILLITISYEVRKEIPKEVTDVALWKIIERVRKIYKHFTTIDNEDEKLFYIEGGLDTPNSYVVNCISGTIIVDSLLIC
ncbi:hypothetical protein Glove_303g136 [Diversispora epigaea]|uniref:Stress response RCI peptide n=1 Tax=Diversispora epigaea TaxID=1348612 RepID=A0A397HUY8_9GLOM|nr:hypothetical protein Glove_303g136 [Diversispora epigaea]